MAREAEEALEGQDTAGSAMRTTAIEKIASMAERNLSVLRTLKETQKTLRQKSNVNNGNNREIRGSSILYFQSLLLLFLTFTLILSLSMPLVCDIVIS